MAPSFEEPEAAALEAPLRAAPELVAPEPGTSPPHSSNLPANNVTRTLSRSPIRESWSRRRL